MADKQQTTEERLKALEERNQQLMAMLEAKIEPASGGLSREDFLLGMTQAMSAANKTSELIASKHKPENVDHLQRGPFEHPEGGIAKPKPALKREMIFGGRLRADELTYAEVEALNALSDSLARSQKRLARDGKWSATVSDDDTRLTIRVPVKTIDDRQDLPPFLGIVMELTSGNRALETADVLAELMLLRSQVADLQAAH